MKDRERERGGRRGEEERGRDGGREGDRGAKNVVFTRILHELNLPSRRLPIERSMSILQ